MSLELFLQIAFSSMIPVTELQGAIPFFLALHPELPPWFVTLGAITGAMVPPIILLKLLPALNDWLHQHLSFKPHSKLLFLKKALDWFYRKVHQKHSHSFERWGSVALIIITGIPLALPGSGVWTGSALAFLFNIPYWKALRLIFVGVVISATIVTAAAAGIINGLSLL